MTEIAKALQSFFASFGLPAYPEESVPASAKLPYITYTRPMPEWRSAAALQARIWFWDSSFEAVNVKTDELLKRIGEGIMIPAGAGFICVRPSSPQAQHMPMPGTPELKVVYLNFQLNNYSTIT